MAVVRSKKGYTKEKLARDELLADGWNVDFKSVRLRWMTLDFAGLFDVVATKGHEWQFISVKNWKKQTSFPAHEAEIVAYANEHGVEGQTYSLWAWDAPRWKGRGKNKEYQKEGKWIKKVLWSAAYPRQI